MNPSQPVSRRTFLEWTVKGTLNAAATAGIGGLVSCRGRTSLLRVGYLPIAASLPLFVAKDLVGLPDGMEIVSFASSNQLAEAAFGGNIDAFSSCALNVLFDLSVATGRVPRLHILNCYSDLPGHITDRILVVPTSPIHTLPQLRRARIAIFPGSVVRVLSGLILGEIGLSANEYQLIEMAPPDARTALLSGRIDAASLGEPTATAMLSAGEARSIADGFLSKAMPDLPLSGHGFAPHVEVSSELVSAFALALARAVSLIDAGSTEARAVLSTYTSVSEEIAIASQTNVFRMAHTSFELMQRYADLLRSRSLLAGAIEASTFVYRP